MSRKAKAPHQNLVPRLLSLLRASLFHSTDGTVTL